jgi:hypothetical protein
VTVTAGAIQIVYGQQANKNISGFTLSLNPMTNNNNDILWRCGTAVAPTGGGASTPAGVTNGTTTVLPQYLPTVCHS